MLPELPRRIECFDISHIQGAETVASLVVWEDGKMNKSAYRKFKVMTVLGVDDFASMREVGRTPLSTHPRQPRQTGCPRSRFWDLGFDNNRSWNTRFERALCPRACPGLVEGSRFWDLGFHALVITPELHHGEGYGLQPVHKSPPRSGGFSPRGKTLQKQRPSTMPSLILIDGGLGQLHAAADALESLGFTAQPLASIAKKEEVIYVYGNETSP